MNMHAQKTVKALFVYFALGSVFAPMAMRLLDCCHIRPIVEDCIMNVLMAIIMVASFALAQQKP